MDISVIMPVYNGADYMKKAIESVRSQEKAEWELWLVDDGSKDESPEICDAYAAMDERIHVIHKENEGPGIARNAAIDQATGEYVFFLDCDDWLVEGALWYLYAMAKERNADVICYGVHKTSDRNAVIHRTENPQILTFDGEDVLRRYFTKMSASICKLFRRTLFSEHHFEKVELCEDAWSMHLFLSKAKRLLVCQSVCYVQYFGEKSRSRSDFSEKNFISETCGMRMVEFAKEKRPDVYGEALYNLIKRQLRLMYEVVAYHSFRKFQEQYQQIHTRLAAEYEDAKQYTQINEKLYRNMSLAISHPVLYRYRDRLKAFYYRWIKYGKK